MKRVKTDPLLMRLRPLMGQAVLAGGLALGAGAAHAQSVSILDLMQNTGEEERTLAVIEREAMVATGMRAFTLWREALDKIGEAGVGTYDAVETDRYAEMVISAALALPLDLSPALSGARPAGEESGFNAATDPLTIASFSTSLLSRPEARAWAMRDLAEAWLQREDRVRAMSNLRRAVNNADEIDDPKLRGLAKAAVARAALTVGAEGRGFATFVLLRMNDLAGRAGTAAAIGATDLAEAGIAPPEDPAARTAWATEKLDAGELQVAADALATLPHGRRDDAEARDKLLARTAAAFAGRGDLREAHIALLGITDADIQGEGAEDLADRALDRGEIAEARLLAESVSDHGSAVKIWAEIGHAYARDGFDTQAAEAFARMERAVSLSGDADDIGRAATAYARAGWLDEAEALMADASGLSADWSSRAYAEIARLMAKRDALAEARALLPKISEPRQKDRALSSVGTYLAQAGDVAAAREQAGLISDSALRDRVWRHIAKADAEAARFDAALAALADIEGGATAVDAEAQIARAFHNADRGAEAAQHFDAAIAGFQALDDDAREEAIEPLLEALVAAGRIEDAAAISEDAGDRSTALRIFLSRLAGEEPLQAQDRLEAVVRDGKIEGDAADRVRAAIAEGLARSGALLPALDLTRTIAEAALRVRTYRNLAERKALELDSFGIIGKPDPAPLPASLPAETGDALADSASYTARRVSGLKLGKVMPEIPDFSVTVDSLRARVPAVAPGKASIALMRYSRYNEKFITAVPRWQEVGRRQRKHSPEFVFVEEGVFDLASLKDMLDASSLGQEVLVRDGDSYILRLPMVIGPKATLTMQGGVTLKMAVENGTYIINVGKMHILDSALVSWDEEKQEIPIRTYEERYEFRPFVAAWSRAEIYAGNSSFVALGFQDDKSYGFSLSAGPSSIIKKSDVEFARPTGSFIDNSFAHMYYAFYSYEADHVDLIGNELRDNVVYGLDPHDRSQYLKIAYNTAYGTFRRHGIIISREVDFSWIVGNISFRNHGTGIMLDRDSIKTLLYANTTIENEAEGITLFESSCALVAANDIRGNKRSGIKLRNSWDVGFYGNLIQDNAEAGVEAYIDDLITQKSHQHREFDLDPYETVTSFTLQDNIISANGVGLKLAGLNSALIGPNVWRGQSPKIFTGDLGRIGAHILSVRDGQAVGIANRCVQPRPAYDCPYLREGYLPGDGQALLPELENTRQCLPEEIQPKGAAIETAPEPATGPDKAELPASTLLAAKGEVAE